MLGVHLLNVQRILVVPHTRCAMASSTLDDLRRRVGESAGQDASWQTFSVVTDQDAALTHHGGVRDQQRGREPVKTGLQRTRHRARRRRPHPEAGPLEVEVERVRPAVHHARTPFGTGDLRAHPGRCGSWDSATGGHASSRSGWQCSSRR